MKVTIVSYSLTGNNTRLAESLAEALDATHVRITEAKPRTMGTIVLDLILNRTPRVTPSEESIAPWDLVLFVGPVWMGQVATPFRTCFRELAPKTGRYAFASISGGADGPNPKLGDELSKRMGKPPAAVIDLHIADLLPPDPKPTRKITSAYRVTDADVKRLTETVVAELTGRVR